MDFASFAFCLRSYMADNRSFLHNKTLTRRRFLQISGLSATALGLSACTAATLPAAQENSRMAAAASPGAAAAVPAQLEFRLTARQTELPILPGAATQALSYTGELIQGNPDAVTALPGSYLGPVVRVQRGDQMRVHVRNELSAPTTVHWHGLIVPPGAEDGHPAFPVAPGDELEIAFEVQNRPGAYWFHPHPHGLTAEQAYYGLAGLVIVSDAEEAALNLPAGAQDIPLVIQDRRFDGNNQLQYIAGGMAGMMDQMMGVLGDRILVNGQPEMTLPVATQPYRLRLLNGSNARIYKLAWEDGTPMTVIGADGGLLAAPLTLPYVMLAPGERVEVWADFAQQTVGSTVKLVSLAFEGVEAGMMGMMMGETGLANGAAFEVMTFAVNEAATSTLVLPARLLPVETLAASAAVNATAPRPFVFAMDDAMNWTINGRTFVMDEVAEDEKVRFGDTEIWELANLMAPPAAASGGMGGMAGMDHGQMQEGNGAMEGMAMGGGMAMQGGMRDFMAHPVHLHGIQFQVLGREVDDAQRVGWESVREGLVDQGWKDTVLLMPGERVRVIMRFEHYRGVYLIHCHNLEHEDSGMMRNFAIV
jgi:FtsP/CotA-like multicopper oxidase with cupredoxin domain